MRNAGWLVLALFGASLCLGAEVYPVKTVRVVTPFAPGGISDIVARLIRNEIQLWARVM